MAEFWYNTSHHTAIGSSPFKALYKTEPNLGAFPNVFLENPQQRARHCIKMIRNAKNGYNTTNSF
jgi:hypothetical protein